MQQFDSKHPIIVLPNPRPLTVRFNGYTIARTTRALEMREADYPAVHYIPKDDVDPNCLAPSDHHSHCPHKGEADYFHLQADGKKADNAVWTYPEPLPAVENIRGYVAFYADKVDIRTEQDAHP